MGKGTYKGLVPQDDPMFSTGPELFSRPGSKTSSVTSASDTGGATPEASTSAKQGQPPKSLPDLQNLPEDPAILASAELDRALSRPATAGQKPDAKQP